VADTSRGEQSVDQPPRDLWPCGVALQEQHEVVLTGEGVQDPHCYFDWNDNVVTVTPFENAYARCPLFGRTCQEN